MLNNEAFSLLGVTLSVLEHDRWTVSCQISVEFAKQNWNRADGAVQSINRKERLSKWFSSSHFIWGGEKILMQCFIKNIKCESMGMFQSLRSIKRGGGGWVTLTSTFRLWNKFLHVSPKNLNHRFHYNETLLKILFLHIEESA